MIVLDVAESVFGRIQIVQRRLSGSLMYIQGGCNQSEADWDGISLASYVHALYGLIVEAGASKVLIIGCGGGTLATMLSRAGRNVTMLDINPISFTLARKYFHLQSSVECHVTDGRSFLRSSGRIYDAIVLDAYNGDRIPDHLQSPSFFRLVRDHLSESGSLFSNVHVQNDTDQNANLIAASMQKVWNEVRVLDALGASDRNAIVMAGSVSQLVAPSLLARPAIDAIVIERELSAMKFRPDDACLNH